MGSRALRWRKDMDNGWVGLWAGEEIVRARVSDENGLWELEWVSSEPNERVEGGYVNFGDLHVAVVERVSGLAEVS